MRVLSYVRQIWQQNKEQELEGEQSQFWQAQGSLADALELPSNGKNMHLV
jgi:hypothetical protein